ncbi:MAG: FHA domain-containing protein [Microscillaceae bacterium]|jgi:hypothetical protein|nr:FHA domain-containing protein [Microscillaceae bacterium]
MSDFKLCENGHYFPQGLKECPYCPKGSNQQSSLGKTIIGSSFGNDDDDEDDFGFGNKPSQFGGGNNLNRTQIFGGGGGGNQDFDFGGFGGSNFPAQFQPIQQSTGRKLVGWLVSFTIDANGIDFKLYEGRNLLGSDPGCDIPIPNDAAVSGRHLTILHRMGHFKFKDEFSTNGTFINDVFMEEGTLKDGDMIRMGDTVFKFRSIA